MWMLQIWEMQMSQEGSQSNEPWMAVKKMSPDELRRHLTEQMGQADELRRQPSKWAKKAASRSAKKVFRQMSQEGSQVDELRQPRRWAKKPTKQSRWANNPSRWAKKATKQMSQEGIQADDPWRPPSRWPRMQGDEWRSLLNRWDKKAAKKISQEHIQADDPWRPPSRCAKNTSRWVKKHTKQMW